MSDTIRRVRDFLIGRPFTNSGDMAKRATAAKRAAGAVRAQLASTSEALTAGERDTLTAAAGILDAVSEAAAAAKFHRKAKEQIQEKRQAAADKAVTQAFADIVDPAGLVAMLASAASTYTFRPAYGVEQIEKTTRKWDSWDANEIRVHERRRALEHFAWKIANDSDNDVAIEAKALRERFDEKRPEIEARHPKLIQWLTATLSKD